MSDYGSAIEGVNWLAIFIQSLSVLFLAPAFFTALYYILLAVYALISKPEVVPYEGSSFNSFAIVIPAHNEEGTIMGVLKSCAELDYPGDKKEVYVVADNCSDRTVEVVKEAGVACLERHDESNKGKGFALEWAFNIILPKGYDAVLVLDADCTIDKNAL